MRLTETKRATFERDGVVALGRVLSERELGDLRARFERLFEDSPGAVRDLSKRAGLSHTGPVLQLQNLHARADAFARLARRPDLLACAAALLGGAPRIFRDHALFKPAGRGGEVELHQDNRNWGLEPPDALTIWIALDDATVETGCVHFLPGTHSLGRIRHERAPDGRSSLADPRAEASEAVPFEVPAGHATAHHCQTLHWSPANRSGRERRAHAIVYMAEGVVARPKSAAEPAPAHTP
jgi:2-oxoglutarate-dependent dioxygenase